MNSFDHHLTDPVWFSRNDPHAIWRSLRAEDPVHWTQGKLPFGFWSLTKYEDMRSVLRDPDTFSSERGEGSVLPTSSEITMLDRETAGFGVMMVSTDPPRHLPMRRAFARTFLRNSIKRFENQGRLLAREIVDEVAPLGACDFVDDVAVKMPMRFICALMGIPRAEWGRMLLLGNMSANPEEPEYRRGRSANETRASAFRELYEYCVGVAHERRHESGDDLLSLMGRSMLEDRVIGYNGILLISAGFETTRNALSGGLLELIRNPAELERLRSDASLIPTAVEEILRWTCPLTNAMRTVTRDVEIRGRRIQAGERVVMWLPSGNRDEEQFPDAERFDVGRMPNDHLSFGHGEHFCLGAHLARLEIRVLLDEIVNRLPDIRLDGEIERICSNQLAGIKRMPIHFSPV